MPDTFQALGVAIVAMLPGALYVWSFERIVGAWGIGLSDRILRFVGFSVVFHALFAPIGYRLWIDFVRSGRFRSGDVPLLLWLVPLAYVAIPVLAGTAVASGTIRDRPWARFFTGPAPAPRAWDELFTTHPDGWIRLRLKSGTWLGGGYVVREDGVRSYAAGYPEPQDLYLAEAAEVDPQTGDFIVDEFDDPVLRGSGILIRWEEVEYLEFIDA
jgi:hypothetical protein